MSAPSAALSSVQHATEANVMTNANTATTVMSSTSQGQPIAELNELFGRLPIDAPPSPATFEAIINAAPLPVASNDESSDRFVQNILTYMSTTELDTWVRDGCLFQGYVPHEDNANSTEQRSNASVPLSSIATSYDASLAVPTLCFMHVRLVRVHAYWPTRSAAGPPVPPLQVLHFDVTTTPCVRYAALVECEWINPLTSLPYTHVEPSSSDPSGVPHRVMMFCANWPPLYAGAIYVCRCAFYRLHPPLFEAAFYPAWERRQPPLGAPSSEDIIRFGSDEHLTFFTRAFVYRCLDTPAVVLSTLPPAPQLLLPNDNDMPTHHARGVEYLALVNSIGAATTADALWNLWTIGASSSSSSRATRLARIVTTTLDGEPFIAWAHGYITTSVLLRCYCDNSPPAEQAYSTLLHSICAAVIKFLRTYGLDGAVAGVNKDNNGSGGSSTDVFAPPPFSDDHALIALVKQELHVALAAPDFWQEDVLPCYHHLRKLQACAPSMIYETCFRIYFTVSATEIATNRSGLSPWQYLIRHFIAPYGVLGHFLVAEVRFDPTLPLRRDDVHNVRTRVITNMHSFHVDVYLRASDTVSTTSATLLFNLASRTLADVGVAMPADQHTPTTADAASAGAAPTLLLVNTTPYTVTPELLESWPALHSLCQRRVGELTPQQVMTVSTAKQGNLTAHSQVEQDIVDALVETYWQTVHSGQTPHRFSTAHPPAWVLWNVHRYDDLRMLFALRIVAGALLKLTRRLCSAAEDISASATTTTTPAAAAALPAALLLLPQVILVGALSWPNNRTLLQYEMRALHKFGDGTSSNSAGVTLPPWMLTLAPPCPCVLDTHMAHALQQPFDLDVVASLVPVEGRYVYVDAEQHLIAVLMPTCAPAETITSTHHSAAAGTQCRLPPIILLYHQPTQYQTEETHWPTTSEQASRAALTVMAAFWQRELLRVADLSRLEQCAHLLVDEPTDNRSLSTPTREHMDECRVVLHVDALTLMHTSSGSPRDRVANRLYSLIDATETALILHCSNYYSQFSCATPSPAANPTPIGVSSSSSSVSEQSQWRDYCSQLTTALFTSATGQEHHDLSHLSVDDIKQVLGFMLGPLFMVGWTRPSTVSLLRTPSTHQRQQRQQQQ